MTSSTSLLRKINLIEVLKEEAEEAGQLLPDDLSEQQLQSWSELQIRQYYAANGSNQCSQRAAITATVHTADTRHPAGTAAAAAAAAAAANGSLASHAYPSTPEYSAAAAQPQQHPQEQRLQELASRMQQLTLRFPPNSVNPSVLKTWFPGLKVSGTDIPDPKAVVICFHNSGNAEDMFTSEGTGSRRAASPLLELCRAQGWQVLAPQLPGRGLRSKEPYIVTLQDLVQQVLPLVAPAICAAGGRYAIIGHSMGCWAAYELLLALREQGLPDPAVACLSGMPWPHIPVGRRPWRQQRVLKESDFKDECRGWDINEVIFSAGLWDMYQPMLRADFKLFDEYVPSISEQQALAATLSCPLRLFWGTQDRRITQQMVQEWSKYSSATTTASSIVGNHLFPLDTVAKKFWLNEVAETLKFELGTRVAS